MSPLSPSGSSRPADPVLLRPSQVAGKLGVSPRTVQRWAKRGTLKATRLPSGQLRIREEDVPGNR